MAGDLTGYAKDARADGITDSDGEPEAEPEDRKQPAGRSCTSGRSSGQSGHRVLVFAVAVPFFAR